MLSEQNVVNKNKLKKQLFNIILISSFLAMILVVNYIFNLFPKVSGISFEIYLSILPLCLVIIPSRIYSCIFLFLLPFFKILIIPAAAINIYDLILEYFLPIYLYFPFIFLNLNNTLLKRKQSKKEEIFYLIKFNILNFIILSARIFFYIAASYLWYIKNRWLESAIYELSGYWLTYFTCLILDLIITFPVIKLIKILEKKYHFIFS